MNLVKNKFVIIQNRFSSNLKQESIVFQQPRASKKELPLKDTIKWAMEFEIVISKIWTQFESTLR